MEEIRRIAMSTSETNTSSHRKTESSPTPLQSGLSLLLLLVRDIRKKELFLWF